MPSSLLADRSCWAYQFGHLGKISMHEIAGNERYGGQVQAQGGYIHNIALAKSSLIQSRFLSPKFGMLSSSMYREHLLSVDNVQKPLYHQLDTGASGRRSLRAPPFFMSQADKKYKAEFLPLAVKLSAGFHSCSELDDGNPSAYTCGCYTNIHGLDSSLWRESKLWRAFVCSQIY